MLFNKRYTNMITASVVVVAIIIYFLYVYSSYKYRKMYLDYQFDGQVENVSYSIKGIATISVNGVQYHLSDPNWDFDYIRIQKGDSIIKKRNSMVIKLIKTDGKIVIVDSR